MYLTNNDDFSRPIPDGLESIESSPVGEEISYDISGRRIAAPRSGLTIIRRSDGTVRKVIRK